MKMRGKLFRIKYDSMRLYTEENSLIGKLFNHEISLFLSFTNILNAKKLELFHPLYGVCYLWTHDNDVSELIQFV